METKFKKLPKAFKKKWVAALRSGKYKQGIEILYDKGENTYCCLGVACRVAHPRKDILETSFISEYLKLPNVPKILKGENDLPDKLSRMNDGNGTKKGLSFDEIADWIEENL